MKYQTIPNTDLKPSVICLGTGDVGGTLDQQASFRLLDAYLDLGGTLIDTASVYTDWLPGERSASEKTIGRWLNRSGKRDDLLLATKGGHPRLTSMDVPRLSRQEIVHDLEASLRNLQTELIDLYWLHRDDPARPVGEIVDVLYDQVQAGKVRYAGCSNWRVPRIQAAQEYAASLGFVGFVGNQMMWSLARPDPEALSDPTMVWMDDELEAYHRQSGLAAIPYSAQANGFYQKLARGDDQGLKPGLRAKYDHPTNRQRFARIQALAGESGLTVTQIVLGYQLSQPFPAFPIVGCKTVKQLQDSASAAAIRLTPEQIDFLIQET